MVRKIQAVIVGVISWIGMQIISVPFIHMFGVNKVIYQYMLKFIFTILIGMFVALIAKTNRYLMAIIAITIGYLIFIGTNFLLGVSSNYDIFSAIMPLMIMWLIFAAMSVLGAFVSTFILKENNTNI